MAEFIKKTFLFIISILSLAILSFWICIKIGVIASPAPNLSASYSFNEKMMFLKGLENIEKINTLSIGSSMSLNNLHTRTIDNTLSNGSYLNAASWGANMEENYTLLKILDGLYSPDKLLIASNLGDFGEEPKAIKYSQLEGYIRSQGINSLFYYLRSFNVHYYVSSSKYAKFVRNCPNDYEYLGYDNSGGVNISGNILNPLPSRWNGISILDYNLLEEQYDHLDSIATYCKKQEIELFIFQIPMRDGYRSGLSEQEIDIIDSHIERIKNKADDLDFNYVNAMDSTWNDLLFIDWIHLNEKGSELFTEYCLRKTGD